MAYQGPPSLADVYQTAGAIKGQRQRSLLADLQINDAQKTQADQQGIDSALVANPNADLQTLIKAGGGQAGVAASQKLTEAHIADLTNHYRQTYLTASEAANSQDPAAVIQQKAPEFIQQYEKVHGQGSFAKLAQDPNALREQAGQVAQQAMAGLVDPTKQFEAHQKMVEDHYKQEGPGGELARNQNTIDAAAKQGALNRGVTIRGQDLANADRGIPTGYERDPAKPGALRPIAGGPHDPSTPKPPGEADKKNAVLFDSMMNSEKSIQALTSAPGGATDTSSKWNAFLGGVPGGAAKWMQTDAYRKYEAAGLRWAANLLYLKSGATANPDEIRSTWKQFFPQPNEGQENAALKEQARRQEIESVRKNMVPGAAPLPAAGDVPPGIAALLDKYK